MSNPTELVLEFRGMRGRKLLISIIFALLFYVLCVIATSGLTAFILSVIIAIFYFLAVNYERVREFLRSLKE